MGSVVLIIVQNIAKLKQLKYRLTDLPLN